MRNILASLSALVMLSTLSFAVISDVRIVNGQETQADEYPNVVALMYDVPDLEPEERHFCGGSVIAERWILTAAHCLFLPTGELLNAANLNVMVGKTLLNEPTAIEIPATAIYVHPTYQSTPIPYNVSGRWATGC